MIINNRNEWFQEFVGKFANIVQQCLCFLVLIIRKNTPKE